MSPKFVLLAPRCLFNAAGVFIYSAYRFKQWPNRRFSHVKHKLLITKSRQQRLDLALDGVLLPNVGLPVPGFRCVPPDGCDRFPYEHCYLMTGRKSLTYEEVTMAYPRPDS